MQEQSSNTFWFPGRWIGGLSLIIGPFLFLAAALLRIQFHFFYDAQLAAYANHPKLITAAYSCFVLGCLFLWPGIITLVRFIGMKHPAIAIWGGMFTSGTNRPGFSLRYRSFGLPARQCAKS